MIEVLFFGRMAEVTGNRRIDADDTGDMRLHALRDRVLAEALASGQVRTADIRMSVNRRVTADDEMLRDGDEVAFFSVFSGG